MLFLLMLALALAGIIGARIFIDILLDKDNFEEILQDTLRYQRRRYGRF